MTWDELRDGLIVYEEPVVEPGLDELDHLLLRLVVESESQDGSKAFFLVNPQKPVHYNQHHGHVLCVDHVGENDLARLHPTATAAYAAALARYDVARAEVQARLDALQGNRRWL